MEVTLRSKLVVLCGVLLSALLISMPIFFPLNGEGGSDSVIALGRFHILALHFPIALLLMIPLLEILGSFKSMSYLKQAVPVLLGLAVLFAALACVLGFLLAAGEGATGKLINDHMWAGIITTVLMIFALSLRELNLNLHNRFVHGAYLSVLFVSIGALTIGSHHGASLIHGEDYLYAKAPKPIRSLIGVPEVVPIVVTYQSPVFHAVIEPIFEQHCYECHSELKQKGQLRMDLFDLMLAGGKSKIPGIVPGLLDKSEIFNRITLPRTDDQLMPPKEKPAMTGDEIALIHWWIEGGASETQSIDGLREESYPEHIEVIISRLVGDEPEEIAPLATDTFLSVARGLKHEYGIDLIPLSQDINAGLYVVTRNADVAIPAQALKDLEPVADYVMSIDLWRRELESGSINEIAKFPRLSHLNLNETNVTSEDLVALSSLKKLRSLNLHGTAIGDSAVEPLSDLRSLRTLRLFDSEMSVDSMLKVQLALKDCEILGLVDPLSNISPESTEESSDS
ncbi:MAG: c-type cytochrome domain-containing protein [Verrucomicrobiota bacterium]